MRLTIDKRKPIFHIAQIFFTLNVAPTFIGGHFMTDTTNSVSLYDRTLYLAKTAPRSVKQCDMAKHLGVSDAWISRFINGNMPNPSVHDCQKLHDYLVSVSA